MATGNQFTPLVSVIITSYNRELFIAETIQSVLASSYKEYEIIIVDDCSTDKTQSIIYDFICQNPHIRYYKNLENLGEYQNRNLAATYARGKYLKYLDSDDIMSENCLEVMVNKMEQYPDAAIGLISYFDDGLATFQRLVTSSELYNIFYFKGNLINCGPSSTIIRKDIFEKMGRFNLVPYLSDVDFIFRICAKYPSVTLSKKLINWRMHPNQEYAYGLSKGFYEAKSFSYFKYYLEDEKNPMDSLSTKFALRNLKNRHARNIIKKFVFFKFSRAFELFKGYELSILDLIYSLRPNRYPKRII